VHEISAPWSTLSIAAFSPSTETASAPTTPSRATTSAAARRRLTAFDVTRVVANPRARLVTSAGAASRVPADEPFSFSSSQ
jgi:hypothetical protein